MSIFDTLGFLSSEGELLLWKSQVCVYIYIYDLSLPRGALVVLP